MGYVKHVKEILLFSEILFMNKMLKICVGKIDKKVIRMDYKDIYTRK